MIHTEVQSINHISNCLLDRDYCSRMIADMGRSDQETSIGFLGEIPN